MDFILRWQLWDYNIFVIQWGLGLMGLSLTRVRLMGKIKAALTRQASPNT